jgi:signal transduction histidine kinase
MQAAPTHVSALYPAYRTEVEGARMTRSLRGGVTIVALLNTCFIPLDWIVFPEHFVGMLGFRLFCNAVMAIAFFRTSFSHPLASSVAGCLAVGLMLLSVIHAAGGPTGNYTPGLMLLFLGMPVLLPFSAAQATAIVVVLLAGLGSLPLISGEHVVLQSYLLHMVFPVAAGVESVFASALLDRLRFADFKQRRELEQARDDLKQLDREKSRFTANVHHELRTPLTLMLAPLEALLGGEFGEISVLQHSYVKTIHTNGLRLLKLINNLLDLAKIESHQLQVTRRPARVEQLVAPLVEGARPLAERKGVSLETHGLGALPMVHVDPDAIEKVIVNLVGNALKFTERGDRIEIAGEPGEEGGILLRVSDTGVGLPADQLERIFDRFAQVDASSTRRHEGTGIGLALARELVELHGGRIWAESDGPGHGARINVALPEGSPDTLASEAVLRSSEGTPVSLDSSIAAMEGELEIEDVSREALRMSELERTVERGEFDQVRGGTRAPRAPADAPEVLICEDNADMRRLLEFLIGQEFRVRLATNGREGLERVREKAPDLILTDVMMPEMTGTELCRRLKQDPRTRSIPLVLVTSKAERELKIEGLELGADDYVTKPFHPRELLARVRSLVRLHALQEQLADRNALLERTNSELETTLDELREAEVQLVQSERLAALGELAAGVAHEVNNPVNFATNALRTLRDYVEDVRKMAAGIGEVDWESDADLAPRLAELRKLEAELDLGEVADSLGELVGIVTEGLDRTHRLVGDLRDFASPGDGCHGIVDLRRGIESTAELVRYAMRQAGITLRVKLAAGLGPVEGDAPALNQVLLNLLKNAAEALEGRGGLVSLSARREGERIMVEIHDNGPGIAPEVLSQLFDPFFSTKGAGRGSGLGLTICHRIVTEHRGSIHVSSTPGEGTTFTIELPVAEEQHAA